MYFQTVREGQQHHGDDDFELWDQSQMYRSEQGLGYRYDNLHTYGDTAEHSTSPPIKLVISKMIGPKLLFSMLTYSKLLVILQNLGFHSKHSDDPFAICPQGLLLI